MRRYGATLPTHNSYLKSHFVHLIEIGEICLRVWVRAMFVQYRGRGMAGLCDDGTRGPCKGLREAMA